MTPRISLFALGGALLAAPSLGAQVMLDQSLGPAQIITFDFTSTPIGTFTPFSATSKGLTAIFSSPDGDVFTVGTGVFHILQGNVVMDNDVAAHSLTILRKAGFTNVAR